MDTRIGILPFDKKNDTEKNYQYEELGRQILAICGSEICVRFPFLCAAVSALSVENTKNLKYMSRKKGLFRLYHTEIELCTNGMWKNLSSHIFYLDL